MNCSNWQATLCCTFRAERAGVDLAPVEVTTNAHATMREKLGISVEQLRMANEVSPPGAASRGPFSFLLLPLLPAPPAAPEPTSETASAGRTSQHTYRPINSCRPSTSSERVEV